MEVWFKVAYQSKYQLTLLITNIGYSNTVLLNQLNEQVLRINKHIPVHNIFNNSNLEIQPDYYDRYY